MFLRTLRWCASTLIMASVTACTEPPPPPAPDLDLTGMDGEVRDTIVDQLASVEQEPDSPDQRRALGLLLQANGAPAQAVMAHDQAIQLSPDDARAWYFKALALADLDDLDGALTAIRRVQALDSSFAPAHWRSGFWLLDLGRPQDALEAFATSARMDINGTQAAHRIGRARALLDLDRPGEAVSTLEQLVTLTQHPYPRYLLAQALRRSGRDARADALGVLEAGAQPNYPDPWWSHLLTYKRGIGGRLDYIDHLMADGRDDQAATEIQAALEVFPEHVQTLSRLAEIHRRRGNQQARMRTLRRALRAQPDDAGTHYNLSLAYGDANDLDKAIEMAMLAHEADPTQVIFLLQVGRLERRANRPVAALAALDKAFEMTVDDPAEHMQYAVLLFQVGRLDDARGILDALTTRPGIHPDAWALTAEVAMHQGDHQGALDATLNGLRMAPDHPVLTSILNTYRQAEADGRMPTPPSPAP